MKIWLKSITFFLLFIPHLICAQDFCIFTCPKSGTSLLVSVVNQITGLTQKGVPLLSKRALSFVEEAKENNQFVFTHVIADWQFEALIAQDYKFLSISRDPRDQLISLLHWIPKMKNHDYKKLPLKDTDATIRELITGETTGLPAFEHILKPILEKADKYKDYVCQVTFEDLVGPNGGGNLNKQTNTILRIAKFLNIPLTRAQAIEIGENSWGNTGTFRKGTIGQWKEYFTPEHIALYKERYGKTLIKMGYEQDLNW